MSLNSTKFALRHICFTAMFIACGHTQAQTQATPSSPRSATEGNQTNLIMARSLYAVDKSGGGLDLPDGSVIRTVWPAALEVTTITVNPNWANYPITPRCDPAVYSLTRIMPDGKELWAKSYIFRGKVIDTCYAEYFGFNVRSALREVESAGYYRLPFSGRFFIEEPSSSRPIEVDVATGDVVGAIPKNLRVINAYALKALKERISKEIHDELPLPSTTKGKMNEQVYKTQLFKRLEKALFLRTQSSVSLSQNRP